MRGRALVSMMLALCNPLGSPSYHHLPSPGPPLSPGHSYWEGHSLGGGTRAQSGLSMAPRARLAGRGAKAPLPTLYYLCG